MSQLFAFRPLRPAASVVSRVASVPYDVVNTDEARALAAGDPLSFLRVTRSEIDLPADVGPYDPRVYARAAANLAELTRTAPLIVEDEPSLYAYRLRMAGREQTGVAGCFSVDEYEQGRIKKHEKTRKDKEDDRTRHITELRAQTGLVFLTYRAQTAIDAIVAAISAGPPLYDFTAADGVSHTIWKASPRERDALVGAFARLDALYIADGHHRAASAARARAALGAAAGSVEAGRVVAVAFPDDQVRILPYNRVVKDLAGQTPEAFLDRLLTLARATVGGPSEPAGPGVVAMFLDGRWYSVVLPTPPAGTPRADALDVEVLQRTVLGPLLGIGDPRTDKRIDFVGGIRGTAELERLVRSGAAAVAFSMFPVRVDDLMAIADAGGIMPPKSTWFEPKLRDGILTHQI